MLYPWSIGPSQSCNYRFMNPDSCPSDALITNPFTGVRFALDRAITNHHAYLAHVCARPPWLGVVDFVSLGRFLANNIVGCTYVRGYVRWDTYAGRTSVSPASSTFLNGFSTSAFFLLSSSSRFHICGCRTCHFQVLYVQCTTVQYNHTAGSQT